MFFSQISLNAKDLQLNLSVHTKDKGALIPTCIDMDVIAIKLKLAVFTLAHIHCSFRCIVFISNPVCWSKEPEPHKPCQCPYTYTHYIMESEIKGEKPCKLQHYYKASLQRKGLCLKYRWITERFISVWNFIFFITSDLFCQRESSPLSLATVLAASWLCRRAV